jgi:hypothetical protein
MAQWVDSFERSGTVASTSKTQVGTDINVPGGERWDLVHLIGGHTTGGSMLYAVDKLPGINGQFPQSTAGAMVALENVAPGSQNALGTVVTGPAVIQLSCENAAATSGTARLWLKVIRTSSGSN